MPGVTFDPSELTPAGPVQIGISGPAPSVPSMPRQPQNPQDVENLVRYHAQQKGVDPDLAAGVARTESSFNPTAVNKDSGASGVMQLMPNTAKNLGVKNIMDANENTEAGVRYLKQLLDKHDGNVNAALTEYGGFTTKDPSDYIAKVTGKAPKQQGKLFNPDELNQPKQIDYQQAALTGDLDPSSLQTKLKEAGEFATGVGRAARPYVPYTLAGVASLVAPEAAPFLAPLAVAMGRGGEQAGLVQSGQQTPEGALKAVAGDVKSEFFGQFAGKGLEIVAPQLAKWVYRKTLGVDPDNAKQAEAIADMVERHIPGGPGRKMTMRSLKNVENTGLNEVISRNANETFSKQDLFGDVAQHYISVDQTAPMSEVKAALGPKGAAIVEKVRAGTPLRPEKFVTVGGKTRRVPGELEEAINDTSGSGAFSNFLGRQGNTIPLNDARKIKQGLQAAVPYGEVTEGMLQGRKIVAAHLADNMRRAIPDPVEQGKFLSHSRELEKLINIEDLPGFGRVSKLPGMETTVPLAGAAVGGASGYYSHMNPMAAAARGAVGRALTGVPNVGVHLLNSPWFRQSMIGAGAAINRNDQPTVQLSPDELQKILRSFDGNQQ